MEIAQYVSPQKGGQGCVRDVIEKVLRLHGKWRTPDKDLDGFTTADF
jgi:3-deoxy-D-manno-octulosonate 8-phosphate phosphatase (KDO 8-P phosphatase)